MQFVKPIVTTHDTPPLAGRTLASRRARSVQLLPLLATALMVMLGTACGTATSDGAGTNADATATDATNAGATDGVGTDSVAADAGETDAGKRPDPVKTTTADLIKIANANVAVWADDGTKRVAFLASSKVGDELMQQDCSNDAPPTGSSGGGTPTDDCEDEAYDAVKTAKDIKEWVAEQIFDAKFVDATQTTDKLVVLCLKADNACDKSTDNNGNDTIDPKCAKGLATVPVCIALQHHGGALLTGELRIGNTPALIPATFVLNPEQISVKVELATLREAVTKVMKAMDEEVPEAFPATASGALSLVLQRDAAAELLSVMFSVNKAARITAMKVENPSHYDIKLAQAAPALKVALGKQKDAVQVMANLGAVEIVAALDLLFGKSDETCEAGSTGSNNGGSDPSGKCDAPPVKPLIGRLVVALAGAHGDLNFSTGKDGDTFAGTGLGLGNKSATVTFHDGAKVHPLLTLDLNADAKRIVDLAMTYTGEKLKLETTPKLDLKVSHTMAVLNPQFDDDIPVFMHKGTSSIRFDGAAKPTFVFETGSDSSPAKPLPTPGGGAGSDNGADDGDSDFPPMKVLAGLLTLKAVGLPTGMVDALVTVKAGMCLGEKPDDGGAGKNEAQHFFTSMGEITCKP